MSPTVCYGRLSTHTGKAYNAPDDPAVGAVFPVFASEQTRTSLCSRFPETQACPPARADRAAGFQKQTPEPMRGRICALEAARAARSPCLVETRPSVCRGSLFGGTWLRKAISWGISRGIYSVPTLTVIVESDPERGADHPPPSGCRRFALGVAPSVYKGGQRGHSPTCLMVTAPAEASSRVSPPSMVSHGRNVPSLCFLGVSQTAKCRMTTIDRWGSPSLQIKKSWLRAAPTVRVLVQEAGAELLEVSLLWDLGQYQNGCCSSGNHIQTTQNPGKMASVSSRISTFRTREVLLETYSRSVTPQVSLSSHWKEPGVTTVGLEQPGFALPELQAKDTRLHTRRKKDLAMGR